MRVPEAVGVTEGVPDDVRVPEAVGVSEGVPDDVRVPEVVLVADGVPESVGVTVAEDVGVAVNVDTEELDDVEVSVKEPIGDSDGLSELTGDTDNVGFTLVVELTR